MRFVLATLLIAASASAAPSTAEKNANDVLDSQIDVIRESDAKHRAPYDDNAVLLGSSSTTVHETSEDYVQLLPTIGSVQTDEVTVDSVAAGGGDGFVWFTSIVSVAQSGAAEGTGEFTVKGKARITQLAETDGKRWKVVASLVDYADRSGPDSREPQELGGTTKRGPLTALLASPKAIAAALAKDPHVFVLGTDKKERAIGPTAAKKLLARWSKLQLSVEGGVREVETKSYGFAQGRVKWTQGKKTYWMAGMILAVPAADGTWKVVGVHYANIVM